MLGGIPVQRIPFHIFPYGNRHGIVLIGAKIPRKSFMRKIHQNIIAREIFP